MKQLLLVLGCYGFVVSPAAAGERWPANVCNELLRAQHILETGDQSAETRADKRFGLLLLRGAHCGVAVDAELAADRAVVVAPGGRGDARTQPAAPKSAPQPRQPMFCDTTPKAYGGSYTDCF